MATKLALTQQIPGPDPTPVLGWRGNLIQFALRPLQYLTSLREQYGDIVALVRGGNDNLIAPKSECSGTLAAFGPHFNYQIFTNLDVFDRFPLPGPAYPTGSVHGKEEALKRLGTGLAAANKEEYKRQRQLLLPAFHKKRVQAYHEDVVTLTEQMLHRWSTSNTCDISSEMMDLTRRISAKTLFGISSESINQCSVRFGNLSCWHNAAEEHLHSHIRCPAITSLPPHCNNPPK